MKWHGNIRFTEDSLGIFANSRNQGVISRDEHEAPRRNLKDRGRDLWGEFYDRWMTDKHCG